MPPRTTYIELKGDRAQARKLTLAHVDRLLLNFRRNNEFQNLMVNANRVNFFDDTGAFVGEVYMQTVHGAENIIVTCPRNVPEREMKIIEPIELIVPCFIVTDDEPSSENILGYIASMNGTWQGPYVFFPFEEDEESPIVMESFYNEGQAEYNEEVALEDKKLLSKAEAKILYFKKPTGDVPSEDRRSEGGEYGGGVGSSNCDDGLTFYDFEDATFVFTVGVTEYTTTLAPPPYGWEYLFDGESIGKYETDTSNSGSYILNRGTYTGSPPGAATYAGRAAFKLDLLANLSSDCPELSTSCISFDSYTSSIRIINDFLDSYLDVSMRTNDTLGNSAILVEEQQTSTTGHSWNHREMPTPYYGEYGATACDGCSESSSGYKNELVIAVDNSVRYSVSAYFDWADEYKYQGTYGAGVVYHKAETAITAIALASVKAGPDPGDYTEMAFIYVGPKAGGVTGSVKFPLQNTPGDLDMYCFVPGHEEDRDGNEYRIRGQIFLGTIRTTQERTIKLP